MTFTEEFLAEAAEVIRNLDVAVVEKMVVALQTVRQREGRLFFLGVGGGAGHASHAVNDFRKIAGFEAYAPSDNVSELTARINDEGWETSYSEWLRGSRLSSKDAIVVFSVGGGNAERNVSANLVQALRCARQAGAAILGIVGPDGGYTAEVADVCVRVPVQNQGRITPHTEAFQAVLWHLLVSHPALKRAETKWESMASGRG